MTKLRSSLYSQALQRRSRPRDNHPSHGFPCTQCPSLSGPTLIIDIEQFSASTRRALLCTIFCHLMKNQLQMAVVVRCTRVVKKVDIDIFVVVNLKENDVTTTWKGRATLHSSRTREETPVGCRNPKVGLRNRSKSGSNGRSLLMTKFCSSPILGLRPHGYPQATVPHPNVPTTTSSEFDKNNLGKPSSPIDTASLNTLSTQGSQLSTVW